jgi:hypothetical protein
VGQIGAYGQRQLAALLGDVEGGDAGGAGGASQEHSPQADGAAAVHGYVASREHPPRGHEHAVERAGDGLDERRDLEAELGVTETISDPVHPEAMLLVRCDVLGVGARGREADHLEARALVGLAATTGLADTAVEHAFAGDQVPWSEVAHRGPHGHHLAAVLVAQDDGQGGGPREEDVALGIGLEAVRVAAADPHGPDADEHLVGADLRIGDLLQLEPGVAPDLRGDGGLAGRELGGGGGVGRARIPVGGQDEGLHGDSRLLSGRPPYPDEPYLPGSRRTRLTSWMARSVALDTLRRQPPWTTRSPTEGMCPSLARRKPATVS